MHSKKPKKPPTTLGATRISVGPGQTTSAEYIDDGIPTDKESRELHFAHLFVDSFNRQLPLGPDVKIRSYAQNDTSDLDFSNDCSSAEYLELATINPLSDEFGREIAENGKINVQQLCDWIYEHLIARKASKYGELSDRAFLLLYPEKWQFILSDSIGTCLAGLCRKKGVRFAGVFTLMAGPPGLVILRTVAPIDGDLPDPGELSGRVLWNHQPGKSEHKIEGGGS